MFADFSPGTLIRNAARELLSRAAVPIIHALGGEDAGFCERVIESCNRDIDRLTKERNAANAEASAKQNLCVDLTSRAIDEIAARGRTIEELTASNAQLLEKLAKGERATVDAVAAINLWQRRAEDARAELAELKADSQAAVEGGAKSAAPLCADGDSFCVVGDRDGIWVPFLDAKTCVGTRSRAEAFLADLNAGDPGVYSLGRLVPADAPVVDIDALRKIAAQWEREGLHTTAQRLRAAIGEKATA